MQNNIIEKTESLTSDDIKILNKNRWTFYIGLFFLSIILLGVVKLTIFLYEINTNKNQGIDVFAIAFYGVFLLGAFGVPIYGIKYLLNRMMLRKKEIANGEKIVITGMLTNKDYIVTTSTSSGNSDSGGSLRGGGGSSSSTSTSYEYFVFIGERKFTVSEKQYRSVGIGKTVEIHVAPLTRDVIKLIQ